jgi:hypothetical protein
VIVNNTCQNMNYYVAEGGECNLRQIGTPQPLMSPPDHLVHRMQTNPYNKVSTFLSAPIYFNSK